MHRSIHSLDGAWDFSPDPDRALDNTTLAHASDRRTIQVPAPWQAQFADLRNYTGVAWYRRTFRIPELHADQRAFVHFGAVDYHTTAWLNGALLGDHEGGYLPFEFPLTALPGENELVVRVNDPGSDRAACPEFPFQEVPHGKQSWYGPIGGIWQSVRVEVRHTSHLTGVQITPQLAEQCAHVLLTLNAPAPAGASFRLTLTDPHGATSSTTVQATDHALSTELLLPIKQPLRWSPETPHLYTLTATLMQGETALDSLSDTFGMRSIASANGQLLLNGEPLYLRGALDQDYYPDGIYTPFSDEELMAQFAQAKAMGLNCLRTHIKITDPRYYHAADRAGLLIWTELPNWEQLTPAASERARATMMGMVERDWNHPSSIIWTIVNENWGTDLMFNAAHRQWLSDTYDMLKARDPHRLIVGNSACFGNFHVVTDIEDFHNYYAIPDHADQWRRWVGRFARRAGWSFAHDVTGIRDWRAYARNPWTTGAVRPTDEVRRRGDEPLIVSEFGNWGLPNVDLLRQHYGGDPWWFESGQEWGDGVVYPHGIEARFAAYGLDRVFGSLAGLSAASQHMQFLALKYEIEEMRRHASISGYVITEFTDVHWESNGLLDMCRNPKAFYDDLGWLNADDLLIPATAGERVAFWGGESCEVSVSLAHHSRADLRGARLVWSLDGTDLAGDLPIRPVQSQRVGRVANLSLTLPAVETGQRNRLHIHLLAADGAPLARTYLDLSVLPQRLAAPHAAPLWSDDAAVRATLHAAGYALDQQAAIRVCATITDADRSFVQSGGRVLWLADSDDAQQATHVGLLHAARRGRSWQGDWASSMSWVRPDGLLSELPTGGLVDWAFRGLTPNHVFASLPPRDFAGDVHAGLFVGWVHQPVALIAERRLGAGRLLGCTFRLREQLTAHPVARVMMNALLGHLA